jgi:hypothetical protein
MNHQDALLLGLAMATRPPLNKTQLTKHYHMAKGSLLIQLKLKA